MFGVRPPAQPLATIAPHIDEARCARRREGDRGCRACVLACPTEAIWIDARGRLRVQEIDCVACGACMSACPTGAIEVPGIAPDVVLRAGRGDAPTSIGCRLGPVDEGALHDASVPCLAALHPEALAARLLTAPDAPLRLDASRCGRCTLGRLSPLIDAHAAQAVAFVRLLGVEPDVRVFAKVAAGDAGPPAPERPMTRRELVGAARDRAAKRLGDAVAHVVADAPAGTDGPLPLPHRADLLAAVRRRVEPGGQPSTVPVLGAFFVDWSVSDACDGCASTNADGPRCAVRCPTGAWKVGHAPGSASLTFDVAACTACGACVRACPQGALTPVPAPAVASAGRVVKRALPVVRCRGCHRPIPATADGMCGNCRKRVGATPARAAPSERSNRLGRAGARTSNDRSGT